MVKDDFKKYSVLVGKGSGILFQPMCKDYTYILTANHNLFEKEENDRGILEKHQLKEIDINILENPLQILINENYFPHINIDIAILKIGYLDGFEQIHLSKSNDLNDSHLCGFPEYLRKEKETINEQYNRKQIDQFLSENDFTYRAKLEDSLEQKLITGYSGGGIMKLENDYISLIGIQSEMTSKEVTGEIEFVPIKYFDDIINENKGELQPLLPPYMNAFKYLLTEIFKLEEAINPNLQEKIRSVFIEQMKLIKLEPYDIYKSDISSKLLGGNIEKPYSKELWSAWLEYLLVLSLVDSRDIHISVIEEVFNKKRLIHSDSDKNWMEIITKLLEKNSNNLEDKATVIISTKDIPNTKRYDNSLILNIFEVRNNSKTLLIDQGKFIKSIKEIIHIKAFESDCILDIKNQNIFNNISTLEIEKIIKELKIKINEFFEN